MRVIRAKALQVQIATRRRVLDFIVDELLGLCLLCRWQTFSILQQDLFGLYTRRAASSPALGFFSCQGSFLFVFWQHVNVIGLAVYFNIRQGCYIADVTSRWQVLTLGYQLKPPIGCIAYFRALPLIIPVVISPRCFSFARILAPAICGTVDFGNHAVNDILFLPGCLGFG
jgi:hypothetical protein